MRRSSLSAGLYVLLVFLSGALVGAFAYRLYMVNTVNSASRRPRSPDEYRRSYIQEMRRRLTLSDAQVTQLQQIMDETRDRFHDLHEKSRPLFRAIEDEQAQKVRAILSDTQRAEYERMRAERESMRKKKR
ncbi:MAG: hypothetical protein ACE15B_01885 [Bryobacteraceae bacterium]